MRIFSKEMVQLILIKYTTNFMQRIENKAKQNLLIENDEKDKG